MGDVPAGDGPTEKTPRDSKGIIALGFSREQFVNDRGEVVGLYLGEGLAFEFWLEVGNEEPFVVAHRARPDALGLAIEKYGERVFKGQSRIVSLAEGALGKELAGELAGFCEGNDSDATDLVSCSRGRHLRVNAMRPRHPKSRLRLLLGMRGQPLKYAPTLALSLLPRQPQPILLAHRFNAKFGRLRQF
jgi:hypothetical protein